MDWIVLAERKIPLKITYKKIRHTYLRIKPDLSLSVTTGLKTKEQTVLEFIYKNQKKILSTLDNLNNVKKPLMSTTIDLFGISYPVELNPNLSSNYRFENNIFFYQNDSNKMVSLKSFYTEKVIEKSYQYLDKWKQIIGKEINLNHIIIKAQWMKSQFGSCQSQTRIIKMNSVLALYDEKYLETILLHEIVHLKVQNHGKDFYKLLLSYYPNYYHLRHELGQKFKSIEG